jgi:hypothetical protein
LPALPYRPLAAIGGLNFNEEPFICGGIFQYTIYQVCWTYRAGAWVSTSPLTSARAYSSYSESPFPDQNLFVIGGRTSSGADLKTIEYLTTSGWKTSTIVAPDTFERHCSVRFNAASVMVIGGVTSKGSNSDLTYVFNSKTKAWTKGPSLITGN